MKANISVEFLYEMPIRKLYALSERLVKLVRR